jgi:Zinc finger, C3HC4 type (RING finger)/Helicase conserved C-terminal domain/SNF2-related domain
MSTYESVSKSMSVLNEAYLYSLVSDSPQVEQPADIKISLRTHQKAVLYEMERRERELSKGMDMSGATLYSRFSFLGDGVGVGKSLMVLGHIARLKNIPTIANIPKLNVHSTSNIYSLEHVTYAVDLSDVGCLIVVPHTLYRQWQTYIKEQTTLKFLGVQTKKVMEDTNLMANIRAADLVLVSNTLYGQLQDYADAHKLLWKRVFYDEADTLHLPSTRPRPTARFSWLISASWPNLLFPNVSHYMTHVVLNQMINSQTIAGRPLDPTMKQFLQTQLQHSTTATYTYTRFYFISTAFFRDMVHSGNEFRGRLILRCREEFVKESITLPPIQIRNILCRTSLLQQVVAHAIPADVRNLLHAGDIQGALQHLGVKSEESKSLVEAVSENRMKELDRLKKTYDFKASLEYSTPQAKEAALSLLKTRIASLEEQIKGLKQRIENYKDEMCPICFDESQSPTLTPCCSRIFCAGCILTSLTRQTTCPLCRAQINASGLRNLATAPLPAVNEIVDPNKPPEPLKKTEQLLELIKNTPNAKFLVFSRYDNPFLQIAQEIEGLKVSVKHLRGNKDVIASTLKGFQKGETKVLLLNSIQAGAGLNITAATHVILLHAMTHEEEKQILGRAYRLGRTEPLEVIRLLHNDEMAHTHSQ